ncbi:MAG TPA: hypothetical protein VH253_15410 [Phycisphaerae bacterium]|nr:hypothetical protein [Phycisphaerae bacterium]
MTETTFHLEPLKSRPAPLVPAETIVAVNTVVLAAGDIPRGILRRFYGHVLGLDFIISDDDENIRFKHLRREVLLSRRHQLLGTVKLTVRNIGNILPRLKHARIAHELLHTHDGLNTTAVLRDPAGNWVHLAETRPF